MSRATPFAFMALVVTALVAGGCSKPPADVRIVLCRDLAARFAGQPVEARSAGEWREIEPKMAGYEDLEVRVRFDAGEGAPEGSSFEAACFYEYEARDENAMTLSNPLSAYSTYPRRVTFNGESIGTRLLVQGINQEMKRQGRELLEGAAEKIEEAGDKFGEAADKLLQGAERMIEQGRDALEREPSQAAGNAI